MSSKNEKQHAEKGKLGRERKKARRKKRSNQQAAPQKTGPSKAQRIAEAKKASGQNQAAKEIAKLVLVQGVRAVKKGDPLERKALLFALRMESDKIAALKRTLFCNVEDAPKGWGPASLSDSQLRFYCDRFFRPGISQEEKDRRKRQKLVAKFAKRYEKDATGKLKELCVKRGLHHGGAKPMLAKRLAEDDVSRQEKKRERDALRREAREVEAQARRDARAAQMPVMFERPSSGQPTASGLTPAGWRHLLQIESPPRQRSKVARKKNALYEAFEIIAAEKREGKKGRKTA